MGYHFSHWTSKRREVDNAELAETPGQNVGALTTAGGEKECRAILGRKGLPLVKFSIEFCTYVL